MAYDSCAGENYSMQDIDTWMHPCFLVLQAEHCNGFVCKLHTLLRNASTSWKNETCIKEHDDKIK